MSLQFIWPPSNTTSTLDVNVISSVLPTGAATEATLSSIDGKDFATQTTLASLLTELQLKADLSETQPVSLASSPLPTGAATEATLSSINGKDFATQTTLASLLTELQLKADLTETQPVSLASSPLPTGAATEVTLASIDGKDFATQTTLSALLTELQLKADLSETQPVSLASSPLPTGAATEVTLSSINGKDFATETSLGLMSAKLPASLGAKTSANSLSVVPASDSAFIVNQSSLSPIATVRQVYSSSPVTTGSYVELIASLASNCKELQIFDSSGQTLELAVGGSGSESRIIYIFPGGNGNTRVGIASGSRISIKAVSATANLGELLINFVG